MKNTKLLVIAGATLGLALSLSACDKKSEEAPSGIGTTQAPPAPDKTAPEQSSKSPGSPETGTGGTSGLMPEKKSDDVSKSQKG